jgi:transcriptional regulator
MYQPRHFEETRLDVLHDLIRSYPLSTLVTLTDAGLVADMIPLLLRVDSAGNATLAGHVARANPLWQATRMDAPVLAIFQGPQHYISPNGYATKREHGKAVPTWNYAVVQVQGPLRVQDDAAWIRQQVTELTAQQEKSQATPWAVDDAPREYTDTMVRALVGIEIPVHSITGKFKLSQNQPAVNQASLQEALLADANPSAHTMAHWIAQATSTTNAKP